MEMINNRNYMTASPNGDNEPLGISPTNEDEYARDMANEQLSGGKSYLSGLDNPLMNWSSGVPVPANVIPGAPPSMGNPDNSQSQNQNQQNFQQQMQSPYQLEKPLYQNNAPTIGATSNNRNTWLGLGGVAVLVGIACWWQRRKA